MRKTKQWQDIISSLFRNEEVEQSETLTVTFQITDACNLKCSYCYQINKHNHIMDIETAKKFIDMLIDNNETMQHMYNTRASKSVIIEFIGGEPFLQVDLIEEIYVYFIKQCILKNHPWALSHKLSICSNGTLYFEPKVQNFIKKYFNDLSFSISIDGNKKLHDSCRVFPDGSGSYDIAHAAMRHFVDILHGYMGSKMTLAPNNIQYTYEAVKTLIEDGYKDIHLNCIYEKGWTEQHAKILYKQLKQLADYIYEHNLFEELYISIFTENFFCPKNENDLENWCGGLGKMISVDYKGDIYPCIRYMESSLGDDQPPLIIGNVNDGLFATEEQLCTFDCMRCIDRRTQSTDECFYCPIAEGCSWCSAYNYQVFGTPNKRATYICIMHKARALANAYYWNKGYILSHQNKRFKIWLPDEEALKIISQDELDMLKCLENFPVGELENVK